MVFNKIITVFCLLFLIEATNSIIPDKISKDWLMKFLTCFQKQQSTGNVGLGIPSYNPYRQSSNFNFDINFGIHIPMKWDIVDIIYNNGAKYNINIDEIQTSSSKISQFQFSVIWNDLNVVARWNASNKLFAIDPVTDSGTTNMKLGQQLWTGQATIKARESVKLQIDASVTDITITLGNLVGVKSGVEEASALIWDALLNSDLYDVYISKLWSEKLTNDWFLQPEKVEKLLSVC